MHPALVLPDILLLVFCSGLEVADLANAALVCRSWKQWASDVRWRYFKIPIRTALRVISPVYDTPYDLVNFINPISLSVVQANWVRFVEVSNKIASITIDCKLVPTIPGAFIIAEEKYGIRPFQNLRYIEIISLSTSWSTVSLFAGPSVTEIRVVALSMDQEVSRRLVNHYIPSSGLGQSLTTLEVFMPRQSDWLPEVSLFPGLRRLSCHISFIRPQAWVALGNGLKLTHLSIQEDRVRPLGVRAKEWDGVLVHLPVLRVLKFESETTAAIRAITHSVMADLEVLRFATLPGPKEEHGVILAHLSATSPRLDIDRVYHAG